MHFDICGFVFVFFPATQGSPGTLVEHIHLGELV